jgi:hypothetical protein
MTDLMERLRAADPVAEEPAAPPVEWMAARLDAADASPPPAAAWEVGDVVAAPPRRTRPRRGRRRRLVRRRRTLLAGLAAATALAAVGVLAGSWSSPDVVAQASEALASEDAIVHTVTVGRPLDANGRPTGPDRILPRGRLGRNSAIQYERWETQDPIRERVLTTVESEDGGAPGIQDAAYSDGVYSWRASWTDNKVKSFRVPVRHREESAPVNLATPGPDPVAAIQKMLADKDLDSAGEVTLGGRRALRLRGEIPPQKVKGRQVTSTIRVEYLVDPDSFEPLRIDLRLFKLRNGKEVSTGGHRVTFKAYERLPLTESNLALLKLPR